MSESEAGKPLILVVEDDPNSQRLMYFFLKDLADICFAESVSKAKEELKNKKIALVLLDLSLVGDEDGLALARWARQEEAFKDLPIIATTAHAFVSDRNQCLEAGCTGYIAKPVNRQELRDMVLKYLPS